MAIENFEDWRNELLLTGNLFQGELTPDSLAQDEAQTKRYVELVSMADGVIEERVFRALLDSMQVDEDNEVYEATVGIVMDFPPQEFGLWLVDALPNLILRQPERAGDLLSLMINHTRLGDDRIVEFKDALRHASEPVRKSVVSFVELQEQDGWLQGKQGWYDLQK